jgi:succinylarginine dihydrolase
LFEAGAANNRTITGQEQEKGGASVFFFADHQPTIKSPQRYPARAVMHSFGEYSFLEDSRYASQQKSAGLA